MDKVIFYKPKKEEFETETYAKLIGEGNYAITQGDYFSAPRSTIYLTRQNLVDILREEEVDLSKYREEG